MSLRFKALIFLSTLSFFSCTERRWHDPETLSDNFSMGSDISVSMDNVGNGIIAWRKDRQIFTSELRDESWSSPKRVPFSGESLSPVALVVSMDNNNNSIVSWDQSSSANGYHVQAFKSEYRNGSWQYPNNAGDYLPPDTNGDETVTVRIRMTMDNNDDAIIVSSQYSSGQNSYLSEYRNGSWQYPDDESDYIPFIEGGDVAMSDNGTALIVGGNPLYISEYKNGSWHFPVNAADNISFDGQPTSTSVVAMDSKGDAVIAWLQYDGSNYKLFKSEYRNGIWHHPSNIINSISPSGETAARPAVAMSDNGDAIIAWLQFNGLTYGIFMSEYRNGSWSEPENISPQASEEGLLPLIAMSNNGDAIITWIQNDGIYDKIYRSQYRDGIWTHPKDLSDSIMSGKQNPRNLDVAMSDAGNAIIVWSDIDAYRSRVYRSEYR